MNSLKQPNIIFVLSDQQRWDTCGCYGQSLNTTPHLDRMAAEGVRFEKAFTCQPVCGPARACLQTGKYATEVGCHINHRLLPFNEKTLAHYVKEQGYDTAYIGKWHLASFGEEGGADDFRVRPVPPERRGGYDYWLAADIMEYTSHGYDGHLFDGDGNQRDFPEGRYRVDTQTDWVIDYLESRKDQNRPFFLFASYIEPHHQNDSGHYEGPHGSKERFKDFTPPGDLVDTKGDWREEYPDYLGCIHSLDQNLGRIRAVLERLGMTDNTLVIYASDHGSHFRTRNGEYKRSCHESSIRVPMVLYGPGFTGGAVRRELVSLIDVPPTILNAAAPPADDRHGPHHTMRGRPLQELVSGNARNWANEVFLQISESQCGRAIRTQRWKYSVRAPGRSGMDSHSGIYEEDFLYDLDADPHERNNLVAHPDYKDIRKDLAMRLKRRITEAGEAEPDIREKATPISEATHKK